MGISRRYAVHEKWCDKINQGQTKDNKRVTWRVKGPSSIQRTTTMAAVHPIRQPSRVQQPDPFGDPAPRSSTTKKQRPAPPPPPPKTRMPASTNSSHHDITEAVRDTVVVRSSTDSPSRAKPHRSATQGSVFPSAISMPYHYSSASSRPPAVSASRPASKRAQTDDTAEIVEKPRPSGKSRGTGKKGSQHADVIDRLDFTGVGPSMSLIAPHDHI